MDLTGYGRGQAKSVQQLWREVSHCPAAFATSNCWDSSEMHKALQVEDGETVFSVSGKAVTRCIDAMLVYVINSSNKV